MSRFQGATAQQMDTILAGLYPRDLTDAEKADRDYKMADRLDKRADEYQAASNFEMAAACRKRALAACIRADEYSGRHVDGQ